MWYILIWTLQYLISNDLIYTRQIQLDIQIFIIDTEMLGSYYSGVTE